MNIQMRKHGMPKNGTIIFTKSRTHLMHACSVLYNQVPGHMTCKTFTTLITKIMTNMYKHVTS